MKRDTCVLVLGGSGLVGSQIVREVASQLRPNKIVVSGLYREEVETFVKVAQLEFSDITFVGSWGNVFVRSEFADQPRSSLLSSDERLDKLYDDLYGDLDEAYERSALTRLLRLHRPDVLVDCINTATAISYQDLQSISRKTRDLISEQAKTIDSEEVRREVGTLLISQGSLQLIRHVQLLHKALRDIGTRLYVKVGTTGTGGMGLNIPYTHSEDKPSVQLMSKSAMAFAHTGLLFLMARTPDGPLVKELKPAAMIGYRRVSHQVVRRSGHAQNLYSSVVEDIGTTLRLDATGDEYEVLGPLKMPGVDTGENGFFARGEFEAISYLDQMEFVTPEEIAQQVVLEIKGSNTGIDVIAGVDSNVISPSYRAGVLRSTALDKLARIEEETGTSSVAVGHLGPPELSKILYEAHLLRQTYGTLQKVIETPSKDISAALEVHLENSPELKSTIASIGLPILLSDGKTIIRGPRINIPESIYEDVGVSDGDIDKWASKGWVDLRATNMEIWQTRFLRMLGAQHKLHTEGTASISRTTYLPETIEIGAIAAWLFNNEYGGYRIK